MAMLTAKERVGVARELRMHEQYVYQVLSGRRAASVERCHAFERALGGRITCESLRPDVAWYRIPDPNWPWHPQGRPLLDVAAGLLPAAANDESPPPPPSAALRAGQA